MGNRITEKGPVGKRDEEAAAEEAKREEGGVAIINGVVALSDLSKLTLFLLFSLSFFLLFLSFSLSFLFHSTCMYYNDKLSEVFYSFLFFFFLFPFSFFQFNYFFRSFLSIKTTLFCAIWTPILDHLDTPFSSMTLVSLVLFREFPCSPGDSFTRCLMNCGATIRATALKVVKFCKILNVVNFICFN